jgi:SRSO17 transposase
MLSNWAPHRESGSIRKPLRVRFSDFRSSREVRPIGARRVFTKAVCVQRPVQLYLFDVATEPMVGPLAQFSPLSLQLVSHTPQEPLWDQLVRQYHYLGCRKLLGRRLKYLAFSKERPVAALSWSAAALKTGARDEYIGWSDQQRKAQLHRIVNNSRFLILPWVRIAHLASHVLALNIRRLKQDWRTQFGTDVLLAETFVDPGRFKATCYKAANWGYVGRTHGSTKDGPGFRYHGQPKEIYLYAIEPRFRQKIGCSQRPDLLRRPPPALRKLEALHMLLPHCQWQPELSAELNITEKEISAIAKQLVDFHAQFHRCLGRIENQRLGLAYLSGLISNLNAKSIEPIALELLQGSVRSLQRFMKEGRWDYTAMGAAHKQQLAAVLNHPEGILSADSSEFVKKGAHSVGVARQYCGRLGKVDNCQSGVFIGYASPNGYGLIETQLYMPQAWFTPEYAQRRKDSWVPTALEFQTKPQIALALIKQIRASGLFTARWLCCDAVFGANRDFLAALPQDLYYFAAIPASTLLCRRKPSLVVPEYSGRGRPPTKARHLSDQHRPQPVTNLVRRLPFKPVQLAESAKGPLWAKVACCRVYRANDELPLWLFVRKNEDGTVQYALSNAPEDTSFKTLCQVSLMRWPIEQCFQEGKSQLGMNHYEHRSWPAWHRHMLYVFLALHFLMCLRIRLKKSPNADAAPGAAVIGLRAAAQIPDTQGRSANRALSLETQPGSVYLSSQETNRFGKKI